MTTFRSLDGIELAGTLIRPVERPNGTAVLVHGGGVTREEGGFFGRLAEGLAGVGIASLRFDLRGHGESAGRQEDLTLAGVANDVRAAVEHVQKLADLDQPTHVIGTSFSGGIVAMFAARQPHCVQRLVLMNPLLNYKRRFIEDKPYWHDDHLADDASGELLRAGFLAHSPSFKLGRPLLNELFYVEPHNELGHVQAPTLLIHGTKDTFISVESSRWALTQFTSEAKLLEIDGSQHGFAVHDDPQYENPQTHVWQAEVIAAVAAWLS